LQEELISKISIEKKWYYFYQYFVAVAWSTPKPTSWTAWSIIQLLSHFKMPEEYDKRASASSETVTGPIFATAFIKAT
jgi:hypothetical protein